MRIIRDAATKIYERVVTDLAERIANSAPFQARMVPHPVATKPKALAPGHAVELLEWEPLALPLTVANVTRVGEHRGDLGVLTVERGQQYEIVATFHCASGEIARALTNATPGRVDRGVTLEGLDHDDNVVTIPAIMFTELTQYMDASGVSFDMPAYLHSLSRERPNAEPTTTVDWFISGPQDRSSLGCRRSERVSHHSYIRRRLGRPKGSPDLTDIETAGPPSSSTNRHSWDYMLIPAGSGRQAAVCNVQKSLGPSWSSGLGIQYRKEWGGVPNTQERRAISDVLGFLFGRHLLQVGSTEHDDKGLISRENAQQPWGRDVVATCQGPDRPPIPVPSKGSNGTEELFAPLIERYLAIHREFDLGPALSTIWTADRLPLGTDLPLLSSALERIMNAWFKSKKTKSRGVYIPKTQFDELVTAELDLAAIKLKGQPYADRIERRLRGAYNMGVNDRYEIFIEELELPLDEGEKNAMRGRNSSAHGGGSNQRVEADIRLRWAYRVLLNRVILHLLGYTGDYVDYSVLGHPHRPLATPIGYRWTK